MSDTSAAFQATPENDDKEVFYCVLMLQLLLSDLSVQLLQDAYHDDETAQATASAARNDVSAIAAFLQRTESRMRKSEMRRLVLTPSLNILSTWMTRFSCTKWRPNAR